LNANRRKRRSLDYRFREKIEEWEEKLLRRGEHARFAIQNHGGGTEKKRRKKTSGT